MNIYRVIFRSNKDAQELADRIIRDFPSFYDASQYNGYEVAFHKRAQLLAADLANLFGFRGTETLTACADYILPLVLRYKGILEYAPELAQKVDNGVEILKDSREEIEIRASTLRAVELIKQRMKTNGKKRNITSMQLNDYLWLAGDEVPKEQQYHLTRTTAY